VIPIPVKWTHGGMAKPFAEGARSLAPFVRLIAHDSRSDIILDTPVFRYKLTAFLESAARSAGTQGVAVFRSELRKDVTFATTVTVAAGGYLLKTSRIFTFQDACAVAQTLPSISIVARAHYSHGRLAMRKGRLGVRKS
jgi:hypothetical protein